MTREEYEALPFAEVRVTHGFPDLSDRTLAVYIDDKPVARLAATRVAFEQNYSEGFGKVTLTMIAGDCQVIGSRSRHRHD